MPFTVRQWRRQLRQWLRPLRRSRVLKAMPQAAEKESGFGARHRRSYMLAIGIGFVMAIIAPLQTDQIPILQRMAYWLILMLSGATIGLGITELVERWGRLRRLPWLEVPLIGVLIALPLTLIVMGAGAMFFGSTATGVFRFGYNFGITVLISVAITALGHLIHSGKADEAPPIAKILPETAPVTDAPEPNRFIARLPLSFQQQTIIALQAEDHYLRVHFDGGQSTMILMRLSDAISELPSNIGAQTHRSWWVAKEAVRTTSKADGRAVLSIHDALEAPVSRSYYKALNDAGWFS